ncbi:hypothetical protein Salat_0669900 [Sesamum alatum]|uniref:Uncharacterized protein n=1 Tax=Sesamum alatum TaxID=300844 RepID=A0AAE2CUH0_9LAMI|nr:hypothetical protein Salat_0669900 [Sesamum alatum]
MRRLFLLAHSLTSSPAPTPAIVPLTTTTPLSTTTLMATANRNRTYLATYTAVHHQPSSRDVFVIGASSKDILPPAKNQPPPTDSLIVAPQPPPNPVVLPTKRTYSNVVQNNTVASLHFDPNRAAKKTF